MAELIKYPSVLIDSEKAMGLDDQSLNEYVNAELELWKREQSTERAVQRQDEVER